MADPVTVVLAVDQPDERVPGFRNRMWALRYAVRDIEVDDELAQLLFTIAVSGHGEEIIDLMETIRLVERRRAIQYFYGGQHADGTTCRDDGERHHLA